MSLTVVVGHNVVDPASWSFYENQESLPDFLLKEFAPMYGGHFPKTARLYHNSVDQEHDITPATPAALPALESIDGVVYVLVYPAEPVGTAILVNVGVTLGLLAIKFTLNSLFPDKKDRTHQIRQGSPNNTLGDRLNVARLGERIPDIYGKVMSVPDLVQVPYITYENHRQVETSLMCVGTGEFSVLGVREGESNVEDINGMSVRIYPPGEAPGGGTPQSPTFGPDITDPAFTVIPVKAVKGDVLEQINRRTLIGFVRRAESGLRLNSIGYQYVGGGVGRLIIEWDQGPEEITDKINVGDELFVDWTCNGALPFAFGASIDPETLVAGTGSPPNLSSPSMDVDSGVLLTITAINDTYLGFNSVEILVTVPAAQQAAWAAIATYSPASQIMYNFQGAVTPLTGYWHGPFFCDDPGPHPNGQKIYCNFVADRGLFADDGKNQKAMDQTIQVWIQPADEDGNATGVGEGFLTTVKGSYVDRTTRATTFIITPTIPGRFLIYARNLTATPWRQEGELPTSSGTFSSSSRRDPITVGPFGFTYVTRTGLIQDEIRWTHCYSMSQPPNISFGDVTLVHTRTVARKDSQGQLSERRLNLEVIRRIPTWDGVAYPGAVDQTLFAVDAFFDILTRSKLGNVPQSQIDFFGIAAALESVGDHFVDGTAVQFSGTFDEDNISLEEMLAAVAECCFCVAYRDGNIVKLKADIDTPSSSLLFNHRNKIPDTEQRSVTFATDEDYDGIELNYFDADDERIKTYFIPSEGTANKYRKISVMGVRNKMHASWHAWRAYYRLFFQNTTVEFDALEEAALAVVRDRILVANNIAPGTQDGDIIEAVGTQLTTSQPLDDSDPPYTVFLQHTDGTVESIDATVGDPRHIALASAPSVPLVTDPTEGVRTGYILVPNSESSPTTFAVVEKSFKQLGVYSITAVNYTAAYYLHEGLRFWLQFNITFDRPTLDSSPYEQTVTNTSIGTVSDVVRGTVALGNALTDNLSIPNFLFYDSYTVGAWIKRDNSGADTFDILCSTAVANLQFRLMATNNQLRGVHDNVTYVSYDNFPGVSGVWAHAALTYDGVTDVMRLYVNGELVDEATSVPAYTASAGRTALNGLIGRADDLRLYLRVLSPESIRHWYQRTYKE